MKKNMLLILILVCGGCSNEPEISEIREPLISDILFIIAEEYPNNDIAEPSLVLSIKTKEIFPCGNYFIVIERKFEDNVLTIDLLSTDIGGICLTALGRAQVKIPLDQGTSQIIFKNGNLVDQYNVYVSKDEVKIEPINSSFSFTEYNTYFRYPENSFACICGTSSDFPSICDNFKNELISKIPSLQEFEFGNGTLPYPDSSSGHGINTPTIFFMYQNETDFQIAGVVLSDFTQKNIAPNTGITIRLSNWKNQHFYSW